MGLVEGEMEMRQIEFIQYMRPSGRIVPVSVARPDDIAALATRIEAAGYHFECEMLADGTCSFTITNDDGDADIELSENGPAVHRAIDAMIQRFAASLNEAA